jgi:hypothetical protein
MIGDMSQRNLGVEAEADADATGTLRFDDAVFRLCTKLNYRWCGVHVSVAVAVRW